MKNPLLYTILRPVFTLWFKMVYRPVFINQDAIPKKGKAILAGTHVCKKDIFLVIASTRRCIRGVAKAELFKGPGKYFFGGLGAIPVNRDVKDGSVVPICVDLLNQGFLVALMPEGTINRTKDIIMPFKTGAVRMAIASGSPIIPFAIIGEVVGNDYRTFKPGVKMVFDDAYYPKTKDVDRENKVLEDKVLAIIKKYRNGEKKCN